MEIAYFNGKFIPKDEINISPDDRGFLFADGIYEVVKCYSGSFFDMNSHLLRLKRSMSGILINWNDVDSFPSVADQLVKRNNLDSQDALIYLQITRGTATRNHAFPSPAVPPTVYASAKSYKPDNHSKENGIKVMLKEDIRWSQCNIKSVSLLPNVLSFQEACEKGYKECIFVRNGLITEGAHSNIFFVAGNILTTHPESSFILSGITRKNVLSIARENGLEIKEEAVGEDRLNSVQEAFITNTSSEIVPVVEINTSKVGNGKPGRVTKTLMEKFDATIKTLHR